MPARQPAWFTEHTVETDPTCPHCDKPNDILHALVHYPGHAAARRQHLPELVRSLATTVDSVTVLFPSGSKGRRCFQWNRLLRFLRVTGLAERW